MVQQSARAVVSTQNGQKYVTQLCKHWSHKAGTTIDEAQGTIVFENGNHVAFGVAPNQLTVIASTPSDGDLVHWQNVVENHLKRFAFREEFSLVWSTGEV